MTTLNDLVVCQSADGWSLHAPGSTDEAIATGEAPYIACGPGEPTYADRRMAWATYAPRDVIKDAAENDRPALEGGVGHYFSAPTVEVDGDGDVYIEGPRGPHWLNQHELETVARMIVAGEI